MQSIEKVQASRWREDGNFKSTAADEKFLSVIAGLADPKDHFTFEASPQPYLKSDPDLTRPG